MFFSLFAFLIPVSLNLLYALSFELKQLFVYIWREKGRAASKWTRKLETHDH